MINKKLSKIVSIFILTVYMLGNIASSFAVTNTVPRLKQPEQNTIKLEGDVVISSVNPKVSLSLRDADVPQVLRMFADKAGLNIVFHPSVYNHEAYENTGIEKDLIVPVSLKATLDLVQVPLNDAFKMVLNISGLTYFMEGKTIFILSQQAAKTSGAVKREIKTIPVRYVSAAGMAKFLNKDIFSKNRTGLSNSQIAVTNTGTNEIIIMGTDNDYKLAKKIVEQFDKKPIEESFVLNHTTPREMAYLLCNVLFRNLRLLQDEESDDQEDEDESDSQDDKTSENNKNVNLAEGSNAAEDEKEIVNIVLGRGLIACQYNNRIKTDAVQSLHTGEVSVTYFSTKGTVLVRGVSQSQLEDVRNFIKEHDEKQLQALIEVSILELDEKGQKDFYNYWNVYTNFFSMSFTPDTGVTMPYPVNIIGGADYAGLGYQGPPNVTYSMKYLIENNKVRVLANPKIIVTNGEKSLIDLSSDYVKTTKTEVNQATGAVGSTTVTKTITLGDDKGIKVELSPFISRDGYITLNIKPQYSTIAEQLKSTDPLSNTIIDATLLQRRNLELRNIRMKDGETLMIGGMIVEDENKKVWKFPFLGDIPGIGMLFRSSTTTKEHSELVIMLTPKILNNEETATTDKGNKSL